MGKSRDGLYVFWDQQAWPAPGQEMRDVEWQLRHGPTEDVMKHRMFSASVLSAYRELVNMPERDRREAIRGIRKAQTEGKG